jgi:hypothetical protein
MLSKFTFKKAYLFSALAVVLTLLSVRFSFWNTLQTWKINTQLNSLLIQAGNVSYQPDYLERKRKNLDKAIALYQVDTTAYRSNVLAAISSLAEQEKVRIVTVPTQGDNPYYQTQHYTIQKIELNGNYSSLMRFYSQLQSVKGIGMIRAAQVNLNKLQAEVADNKHLQFLIYLEITR